jgi:flagellar hook-length control protein FliK
MQESRFMNIDSANSLSILPTQIAPEGSSLSTTGSESPSGFLEAFETQLTQLSEGLNPGESINSAPIPVITTIPDTQQSFKNLLGNDGDMQKLAAFFGKELPSSYKVAENLDQDSSLSALSDTMGLSRIDEIQGITASQITNNQSTLNDIKIPSTDNQADMAEIMSTFKGQNPVSINAEKPLNDSDNQKESNESSDQERSGDMAAALLASLVSPLSTSTVENKIPENPTNLTVLKSEAMSALLKNTTTRSGSPATVIESNQSSDYFLQKQAGEQLSEQNKPVFNLNDLEKTGLTDKNGSVAQDLILGGDNKNLARGVAEINQLNKHPAEIRAEVPGLSKPIDHPEWNKDLGERILWMNSRSMPSAEIKLNPQHLGPISVRVDMNQDQATISFAAQHGSVRDALEASIPKLRELLSTQQLNLTDVNISQHFSSDHGRSQPQNFAETAANADQNSGDFSNEAMTELDNDRAIMTKGLLSIYA